MPTPHSVPLAPRAVGMTYSGTSEHIRTVRADLRRLLPDGPIRDDVILCASELAANAAQHSNSRLPGGTFTVRLLLHPDWLRVEVEDQGGPWQTHREPHEQRGRGLHVVSQLAAMWDVTGDGETGRTVWFHMDLP